MTINIDPSGRIVMPCYVLQEYNGKTPVWDVDVRALWNSFEWERYGSCNKCALACYLEPSLFSWANPAMVRERVLEAAVAYLRSRRQYRAHDRRTALESGKRLPVISPEGSAGTPGGRRTPRKCFWRRTTLVLPV